MLKIIHSEICIFLANSELIFIVEHICYNTAEGSLFIQENDESKSKRRRKGDVEFENQIAMAMMASANPNPSRSKEDDVINELQPANGLKNPKAFVRKLWREHEANKGSMGATWARCSQNQVFFLFYKLLRYTLKNFSETTWPNFCTLVFPSLFSGKKSS